MKVSVSLQVKITINETKIAAHVVITCGITAQCKCAAIQVSSRVTSIYMGNSIYVGTNLWHGHFGPKIHKSSLLLNTIFLFAKFSK